MSDTNGEATGDIISDTTGESTDNIISDTTVKATLVTTLLTKADSLFSVISQDIKQQMEGLSPHLSQLPHLNLMLSLWIM